MSYGIYLQSISGYTQIDQDYENYALHSSGSVSASGVGSSVIPFNYSTDFILVRSDSYNIPISIYSIPNTNSLVIFAGTVTDIIVEYVILRKVSILPLSIENYGFEVYKSNGTVAYSSRGIVPSIKNSLNLTAAQAISSNSFNLTIPEPVSAGKKRYFNLLAATTNKIIPDSAYGRVIFQGRSGKFINDNSFTTDFINKFVVPIGSSFTASWASPINFIILDI